MYATCILHSTVHQFYNTIFTDLVTPCKLCEFLTHASTTSHRSGILTPKGTGPSVGYNTSYPIQITGSLEHQCTQTWNSPPSVEPFTSFTRTRTLPLFWTSWVQYLFSHPVSLIFILSLFHLTVSSLLGRHNFHVVYWTSFPCILHRHLWFEQANEIWWGVKVTKLLIMLFSPASCYFLSL
jgi:hypothetical protein